MTQKVAIVTGGAQGIGRAVAALLVQRGYGVVAADLGAPAGKREQFLFVRTDVSSEPSVRGCVRTAMKRFGRLAALVNNAGIASPGNGPVEKLALREWNRRIGINLTGAFLMAKHCVPHLKKRGGAIVNIASTRALESEPGTEAYAASKGGLVALTHALALSLGP